MRDSSILVFCLGLPATLGRDRPLNETSDFFLKSDTCVTLLGSRQNHLPSSQLPGSASAFQHPSTLFCVNTSQPPSIMIILPYSSGQLIRGGRKLGYCNRTCWWGKSNRRPCWNPHYPYKAAKPHGSFLFCLFFVLSLLIKSGEGYHWLQTQQKPPKLKLHSGACPLTVTLQEKTVMWTFSVRPFVLGGS